MVATAEGKKPKHTKVGHCGTLDPLATGLLILVVGKEYTRRAGEFSKLDKTYEVTMKLGETSTTADDEGEKTVVSDTVSTKKAVLEALERLQGHIMQVPPQFSAMKINGQRAYKMARAGEKVELEARPVTIHSNELTEYSYPFVKFTSRVSSGTYIRSLVEDLGKILNTGAYMSDLCRTEIGTFTLKNAISVESIHQAAVAERLQEV
jgi:tRNA pseudouridine55 synthase